MESAQFPWQPLGALLVEKGLLTRAELSRLWPSNAAPVAS
jgi:hypothetical protein